MLWRITRREGGVGEERVGQGGEGGEGGWGGGGRVCGESRSLLSWLVSPLARYSNRVQQSYGLFALQTFDLGEPKRQVMLQRERVNVER